MKNTAWTYSPLKVDTIEKKPHMMLPAVNRLGIKNTPFLSFSAGIRWRSGTRGRVFRCSRRTFAEGFGCGSGELIPFI
jgi:hypothetical protein